MTYECEGQLTMFDQDTWFGRMFREPSQAEIPKEQTSRQSLKKSSKSKTKAQLMCLSLKGDGVTQAYSWETDSALLGEYMMRNFGEFPNEERESHLSQILMGGGAGKILFEPKSLSGNTDESRQTREETTGYTSSSTGEPNAYTLQIRGGCDGGGKGALIQTEKTGALGTVQDKTLFCKQSGGGITYSLDEKMGQTYVHEEQANTLAARDFKQPQCINTSK